MKIWSNCLYARSANKTTSSSSASQGKALGMARASTYEELNLCGVDSHAAASTRRLSDGGVDGVAATASTRRLSDGRVDGVEATQRETLM